VRLRAVGAPGVRAGVFLHGLAVFVHHAGDGGRTSAVRDWVPDGVLFGVDGCADIFSSGGVPSDAAGAAPSEAGFTHSAAGGLGGGCACERVSAAICHWTDVRHGRYAVCGGGGAASGGADGAGSGCGELNGVSRVFRTRFGLGRRAKRARA